MSICHVFALDDWTQFQCNKHFSRIKYNLAHQWRLENRLAMPIHSSRNWIHLCIARSGTMEGILMPIRYVYELVGTIAIAWRCNIEWPQTNIHKLNLNRNCYENIHL